VGTGRGSHFTGLSVGARFPFQKSLPLKKTRGGVQLFFPSLRKGAPCPGRKGLHSCFFLALPPRGNRPGVARSLFRPAADSPPPLGLMGVRAAGKISLSSPLFSRKEINCPTKKNRFFPPSRKLSRAGLRRPPERRGGSPCTRNMVGRKRGAFSDPQKRNPQRKETRLFLFQE